MKLSFRVRLRYHAQWRCRISSCRCANIFKKRLELIQTYWRTRSQKWQYFIRVRPRMKTWLATLIEMILTTIRKLQRRHAFPCWKDSRLERSIMKTGHHSGIYLRPGIWIDCGQIMNIFDKPSSTFSVVIKSSFVRVELLLGQFICISAV